ncbi:hypothetical protein CKK33_06530 [Mucilaginibacter sp. MD40]|uniref:metallophosphoesterase n=1 Tax=Mucilaginibacter sp. MD40 TaxID=2029590 RepID=UPI000BACBBE8|nr:metallophosphoesterase [Mucilaginibacter sp. MD40]PAW93168.1 hypothetical protein CKK33_06530 [Mucilaginibacter sp. MD40]
MTIGIAHFTDIHFTIKTDIDNKIASCLGALKNDFSGVKAIYFVLSGDIAYSGKKQEYDLAKVFFNKIIQLLKKQYPDTGLKVIIVPGNHDCNFSDYDSQLRKNSIENISYDYLGDDNSVIDTCLSVQADFWDFYKIYNDLPSDKLFYKVSDIVDGRTICFHCINTSWMSQIYEQPGKLFFPARKYDSYDNEDCYLNIGVWHHPYNWFNPGSIENNKKELEHLTERIASVHLIGHEHVNEFYTIKNNITTDKINIVSGKVFNEDSLPNESGFETIIVDIDKREGGLKTYSWDKDIYKSSYNKKLNFFKDSHKKFEFNSDFIKNLDEIKIPLTIGERRKVKLSDIFIFPHLDTINSDTKILENYQDSESIIDNKFSHCVIAGDDQIGKSSLLSMIYLNKLKNGVFPLMITGKDIKELDFNKILKRAFRRQYINGDENFDAYQQLDKSKKILLVDDYHHCKFPAAVVYKVLKELMPKFEFVLLSIDSAHSLLPVLQTEFKDVGFYKIKPFGYSKRNSLIERYNYLKRSSYHDIDDIDILKESFDKVGAVLGDKLIPSYPIFILSILQSLEYNSLRQNETSFGYCYQTLIHFSLHKAKVKSDDIDTYFNFLTELAFAFVDSEKEVFREEELLEFFASYKRRFITPSYNQVIETLKQSKILVFEDDEICFGYDYILYYLSAKKISDIIHTEKGKSIVTKLFKDLQEEKNGNILVFVTHHSKDISFIEDSLLTSMDILSDYTPITLALNDPFYIHIKAIAEDVSKEILEINRNPREERKKHLQSLDESESRVEKRSQSSESYNAITLPFKKSFRSIEIIGQIVRNRKGSLEISQLKDMIKEVYDTGFRTISYSSELLISAKNQIILMLNEDDIAETSKKEIEKGVTDFVMMSSFESCIGIFSKIMQSMGLKDLKDLFNEVAIDIDTPAAKLVSFGINSYYGSISENELRTLVTDLKGNAVAMKMLRGRVQAYVYSKNLDIRTKQKFANLLGMTISPNRVNKS